MICRNCGTEINEGEKFCPICGAKTEETVAYNNTYAGREAPLGLAIAALVFSNTFFLSFIGIILAAVAKGKMKAYKREVGVVAGKAKVANILSTVALILSIVMTVFFAIYIIVIVAAVLSAAGTYSYYY